MRIVLFIHCFICNVSVLFTGFNAKWETGVGRLHGAHDGLRGARDGGHVGAVVERRELALRA